MVMIRRFLPLSAQATNAISGTSEATFTATGALGGVGALAGTSSMVTAAAGTLDSAGTMSGSAAVSFAPTGALVGSGALAGPATATFVLSGNLTISAALSGTASVTFTVSGFGETYTAPAPNPETRDSMSVHFATRGIMPDVAEVARTPFQGDAPR